VGLCRLLCMLARAVGGGVGVVGWGWRRVVVGCWAVWLACVWSSVSRLVCCAGVVLRRRTALLVRSVGFVLRLGMMESLDKVLRYSFQNTSPLIVVSGNGSFRAVVAECCGVWGGGSRAPLQETAKSAAGSLLCAVEERTARSSTEVTVV